VRWANPDDEVLGSAKAIFPTSFSLSKSALARNVHPAQRVLLSTITEPSRHVRRVIPARICATLPARPEFSSAT